MSSLAGDGLSWPLPSQPPPLHADLFAHLVQQNRSGPCSLPLVGHVVGSPGPALSKDPAPTHLLPAWHDVACGDDSVATPFCRGVSCGLEL